MFTAVQNANKALRVGLLAVLVALSGCASLPSQDTETAYYETAQEYLEKRNYSMAVERLTALRDRFPFGRYADASALDLMYAYYGMNDFANALVEADRFTRLNSEHPDVDYAWFVRSMSYYELFLTNRGILGKADPAKRSAEQGQKAFRALSQFTARYPDSRYRPEALDAMVILKDALARHELVVADYYIRREAWIAAAERAKTVVEHYPGVTAVGDALVVLIEAYDALDMPTDRSLVLSRLTNDYPDHPTLRNGEYQPPRFAEDRWWVKALTLGLTS
ncbi:outer membrane protein assembly factor BamD [Reinekea blandensis]|uniref:Outer membrane protein assembly factor BamD n=1 Tax=Reinekea blandensis MED297 TaxID=314283 RepID=A4BJJ8_9GAMM|nr:outer membrane protein assembly factor BamD [Reinekea blandensis]EAR07702.1 competence lipoprotein ComL, putative [Reinekea sp. MED297] [Reinekea blandensis MED297]